MLMLIAYSRDRPPPPETQILLKFGIDSGASRRVSSPPTRGNADEISSKWPERPLFKSPLPGITRFGPVNLFFGDHH